MAAPLHSKLVSRERILVFGGAGTGKSTAWLQIARRCPTSTFFAIESDRSDGIARFLETEFTDLGLTQDGGNIRLFTVDEWPEWVNAMQTAKKEGKRDDWLIPDLIGQSWESIQEFFTEKAYKMDFDAFLLEHRLKAGKKAGNALDGDKDWGVINPMYRANISNIISKKFPGHVFAAAGVTKLGERDDKALKDAFGVYGVRPVGQKHMPHLFHTQILMTKRRVGEWYATTCRDNGRPEMEGQRIENFANEYLMKIGGWRPGRPAAA